LNGAAMDFFFGSKFNLDLYAVGEPAKVVPFGQKPNFSRWASACSSVREEGVMVAFEGTGRFELQTGYEWWIVGSFDLGDLKAGEERQFSLAFRHLKLSPVKQSESAYGQLKKKAIFNQMRAEARQLLSTQGEESVPRNLLCGPELGQGCLDGVGFDYEMAPTGLRGEAPFYCVDIIQADEAMARDFKKKTGRDMKEATLEELCKWYGEKFAAWYGEIYRYLK